RGQTFVKVQQYLDRIEARIYRRCERFPVGFGFANELRLRCVAGNEAIKSCNRETRVAKVKQKKQEDRRVGATHQSESLLPFAALNKLRPPLPPTVRQAIEFNRRRRCVDSHQLISPRELALNGTTKFVTPSLEPNY